MADCEMEISRTIWSHKYNTKIVVKPDGDGLGLVEIVKSDSSSCFIISTEEARLLAAALLATATEVEAA